MRPKCASYSLSENVFIENGCNYICIIAILNSLTLESNTLLFLDNLFEIFAKQWMSLSYNKHTMLVHTNMLLSLERLSCLI